MKIIIPILYVLLTSNQIYSQSKTEKIEMLEIELDSLKKQNYKLVNQVLEINNSFLKAQEKLSTEREKNEAIVYKLKDSLTRLKTERDSIQNKLKSNSKQVNRNGLYSYKYNAPDNVGSGSIRIEQQSNNSFSFLISVDRVLYSEELFTGEIEGIATFRNETSNIATYSDENCESLYFIFTNDTIEIQEFGCLAYHGARVSFDNGFLYIKEK